MKTTIILPDNKYNKLKDLAHRKSISLARAINDAIDQTYFNGANLSFKQLKGKSRGSGITDKEIDAVKIKLPAKL